ncbi:DUF4192 domain-containing protein [Rhodococcus sp. NPDC058505]|uniref:DUF4192 domain-containing protein n=1 Tax=unclassified Rhodococcus (in: high G+C Gram-positive bacteria) TaxID=192944 RepID=UPI003663360F
MTRRQPNPAPDDEPRLRISEPGDLIAAIPAMLGFRPHRSIVVISLGGTPTAVQTVMRQDLPAGDVTAGDRAGLELIARVCARSDASMAVAVVVDDREPGTLGPAVAGLVDGAAAALIAAGVMLTAVHATPSIEAGRPWWGILGDPRCGRLPDPTASTVAAEQVLRGRPILASRAELARILHPLPRRDRLRMARLLAVARHPASRAVPRRDRAALEFALTRIATVASTGYLTDDEIVALSVVLERPAVRDSLLGLAVTAEADAADQTWIVLARALPGPARAEPAALLGFSSYVRGNGPLAGVALAAALAANPDHRLAGLLDHALATGIRPGKIADLAGTGHRAAADLGVALPPVERERA